MKKLKRLQIRNCPRLSFCRALPAISFSILLFFSWVMVPSPSMGEAVGNKEWDTPLWWPDTHKRAVAGGYGLITIQELQALMQSGREFVLLDVRPDYEYMEGHILGARNFEFHLGHRSGLEPERAEALKALLGPDRDRLIVTYCRNFR